VEVQRLSVAAWMAEAQGPAEEALRLMRAAADLEDRIEKRIVTSGRVQPARELLAALQEFEQSQRREPNRLRGLAGAAAEAEAAGLPDRAAEHHARLIEQAPAADPDYAAASAVLKAADFARALPLPQAALKRFPDSAKLHNELGYSHRKLGQLAPAFDHYKRALAIDPRHRSAHEYIGEAYLMEDDLTSAEKHLEALRAICVLGCEELRELKEAIKGWRRRQVGAVKPWRCVAVLAAVSLIPSTR